jgi:Ca-activated chloride channel homolog
VTPKGFFFNMKNQLTCCALGFVCCFLFLGRPAMVWAESARSLTAQGNELYARGEYEAALKAYEQAESEQPEAPEIPFNKGNAWFQQGDFEKAKGAYEAAALKAKDPALEAKSQFNMGDGAYSQGRMLLSQDPKRALEQYRQSAAHFKEALRFRPDFQEAAENLELVRFGMKQIEEQLKRQQEQQQQQQKDKDKEPSEKAEAAKDGEQEREQPENKNSEGQDQQSQEASRAKPDASRETEDQKPKPGPPSPGQEQPEEQGKTQHAAKAEDEKTPAAELARDILREEKELRLQRDRAQRSGYLAVEKDW